VGLNYAVAPGTILKEYIEERGLLQKVIAERIGVSAKHLSNIINGKVRLSEEVALSLEEIFVDISAEFWMDLEVHYQLKKLRELKGDKIYLLKDIAKKFQFKEVFKGLGYTLEEQAKHMLDLIGLEDFDQFDQKYSSLQYDFMEDGGTKEAQVVWLKLCEEEVEVQNNFESLGDFDTSKLVQKLPLFKKLLYTQDFRLAISNIRRLCNQLGITLVLYEAIPNSKIRAATRKKDNHIEIFLSTRYKMLDTIYFAFIHELGHILEKSLVENIYSITLTEDKEQFMNNFAKNFFLDNKEYEKFTTTNNNITEQKILEFAREQKVIPDIVIGFLEHDKIVRDHSKFYHMRGSIKEVN
jgi:addiction module HigA family antidote